jgi:Amyotrophic lateral sclerosis 2 chromosomal region candidate gene 8
MLLYKIHSIFKAMEKLKSAESPRRVKRFYIAVSSEESHSHNRDSSHLTQETHPEVIKEIYRLVEIGVSSVRDMKLLLDQYIDKKFENGGKPSRINSSFYPSGQKIYAHMHKASFKLKKSLIDQEALSLQIEEWKKECPNDSFFFREYKEDEVVDDLDPEPEDDNVGAPKNSILFCHQTEWQKRLLSRYGRICLLDATYKTTKYSLPLFF